MNDELLSRLSQLNRQRLPSDGLASKPRAGGAASSGVGLPPPNGEDLSQLPAGTIVENSWGAHWLRERPIDEVWPQAQRWLTQRIPIIGRQINSGNPTSRKGTSELRALIDALPDGVIYLDLETCGFAGSMVFLVGLILFDSGQFVLSQLLARHYGEEKAMLQTLWDKTAGRRVLATFNGKSFDWPMVHDRSTIHHLGRDMRHRAGLAQLPPPNNLDTKPLRSLTRDDPRPELVHCDLLHHARRHWKHEFPNCKLQTLEKLVCQRRRTQDIAGREIPAAYHDFVRSKDAWLIRSVLHHNALDLITLLQLSVQVAELDVAELDVAETDVAGISGVNASCSPNPTLSARGHLMHE